MAAPRERGTAPRGVAAAVCTFAGISLGVLVFVAARISNPRPVDPMDVEYWDILGSPLPQAELMALTGGTVGSRVHVGRAHVLLFADPGCGACEPVYPKVAEAKSQGVPVLVVYRNGLDLAQRKATERELLAVSAYDSSKILSERLHVTGLPAAVLVDADGIVRKAASGDRSAGVVVELSMAVEGGQRARWWPVAGGGSGTTGG